jgi:hypothetical protein
MYHIDAPVLPVKISPVYKIMLPGPWAECTLQSCKSLGTFIYISILFAVKPFKFSYEDFQTLGILFISYINLTPPLAISTVMPKTLNWSLQHWREVRSLYISVLWELCYSAVYTVFNCVVDPEVLTPILSGHSLVSDEWTLLLFSVATALQDGFLPYCEPVFKLWTLSCFWWVNFVV